MNIKKSFFTISFITFFTRVLGGIRDIVSINYIGISSDTDSFLVARRLQSLFVRIFGEGAMQNAITPYIIDYEKHGKLNACKRFVSRILTVVLLVTFAIAVLVNVYSYEFIAFVAPGFKCNSEYISKTIRYLHVINPSIVLVAVSSVYFCVTSARQKFTLISLYGMISNIVLMFFIMIGRCTFALAIGHLIVCFIQYAYCYSCARYYGCTMPTVVMPTVSMYMRRMLKKILPSIIGTSIIQFDVFVSTIFASYLQEKSITYVGYCDQIVQVPISMIGTALATILLPHVAAIYTSSSYEDKSKFDATSVLNFALILSLPIMIMFCFFSYTIIEFIGSGSGKITHDDILKTAQILSIASIMIPLGVVSKIMASISLAQKKTFIPMIASILTVISNISVCLWCIKYDIFSVYVSMIAFVVSMVFNVGTYLYFQRKLLSGFMSTFRILISAFVMFFVMWLFLWDKMWTGSIVRAILFGSLGLIVYLCCLIATGDIKINNIVKYFTK